MAQAKITKSFNSWQTKGEIIAFEDRLKARGFEIEAINMITIFGVRTIRWEVNVLTK